MWYLNLKVYFKTQMILFVLVELLSLGLLLMNKACHYCTTEF